MPRQPKHRASDAEKAAVHYLHVACKCVVTRRAISTPFQKVDFFACDVMGKQADGAMVWAQVTTGDSAAVAHRRRKLEAIPWRYPDDVLLLQMITKQDDVDKRKLTFFFRIHRYCYMIKPPYWYVEDVPFFIPRLWFKPRKET